MSEETNEAPLFDMRELQEINHCLHYTNGTNHGTDGHLKMNVIAKLMWAVFNLDQDTEEWEQLEDVYNKVM